MKGALPSGSRIPRMSLSLSPQRGAPPGTPGAETCCLVGRTQTSSGSCRRGVWHRPHCTRQRLPCGTRRAWVLRASERPFCAHSPLVTGCLRSRRRWPVYAFTYTQTPNPFSDAHASDTHLSLHRC
uniref:Uncharacterized protein n=1 Tax=Molossus molossus TaxID=27622 RepID=A0A7J8B7T7_MOLMO|nr:hypothetical protein HJG59_010732 [Molossus molossus]